MMTTIGGLGGSGAAQMLQQMQQKMQTAFSTADADQSGGLSQTEFASFDAAMRAGAPQGMAGVGQGPSAAQMFSMMDANGDGQVTQAEMQDFKPPMPPMAGGTLQAMMQDPDGDGDGGSTGASSGVSDRMQALMKAFEQADTNKDGALDSTEFAAFDKAMRAQMPNGGVNAPSADQMFGKLDTNGDGKLTLDELTGGMHAHGHPHGGQMPAAVSGTEASASSSSSASALIALLEKALSAYGASSAATTAASVAVSAVA